MAAPVQVRFKEGLTHGFLVLRDEAGKIIAAGQLEQTVRGAVVTSSLRFSFTDGSVHEEKTVFSQNGTFKVLRYHLLDKGPFFKNPIEVWVERAKSEVRVCETKDGKNKITSHHMEIPDDLANGIVPIAIKNFAGGSQQTLTMIAATPKPRTVKLVFTPQPKDFFLFGESTLKANHYVAKVQIGGVAGAVAPIVGKQPPDTQLWVLPGTAPVFLKSKGPISPENPVVEIELASPSWAAAHS